MVEKARPAPEKYAAEVVLKKLRWSFHASDEVVEKPRPSELKCVAELVEKKLLTDFQ